MNPLSYLLIIKNPEFYQRTKHSDILYHIIRELYDNNKIAAEYISSENQSAAILPEARLKQKCINYERQNVIRNMFFKNFYLRESRS